MLGDKGEFATSGSITLLDVSDPQKPLVLDYYESVRLGWGKEAFPVACITEQFAYLSVITTHTSQRLDVFDISNFSLDLVASKNIGVVQNELTSDSHLMIFPRRHYVDIFDVSSGAPVWLGRIDRKEYLNEFGIHQNKLYIANSDGGIEVVQLPDF